MPDPGLLQVGDRIRLIQVPSSDAAQRERELQAGSNSPGWTANTLERIIESDPVVTISRIDERGAPWFEVQLVEEDGRLHHHSLNITDNDSWVFADPKAAGPDASRNPYAQPETTVRKPTLGFRDRFGFFSLCLIAHCGIATLDLLQARQRWPFSPKSSLLHFAQVLCGPIDLYGQMNDRTELIIGPLCFLGLIAYPIRPSIFTGVITALSFILWLLFGLGIAYIGV
jgi:hypothetical protein